MRVFDLYALCERICVKTAVRQYGSSAMRQYGNAAIRQCEESIGIEYYSIAQHTIVEFVHEDKGFFFKVI